MANSLLAGLGAAFQQAGKDLPKVGEVIEKQNALDEWNKLFPPKKQAIIQETFSNPEAVKALATVQKNGVDNTIKSMKQQGATKEQIDSFKTNFKLNIEAIKFHQKHGLDITQTARIFRNAKQETMGDQSSLPAGTTMPAPEEEEALELPQPLSTAEGIVQGRLTAEGPEGALQADLDRLAQLREAQTTMAGKPGATPGMMSVIQNQINTIEAKVGKADAAKSKFESDTFGIASDQVTRDETQGRFKTSQAAQEDRFQRGLDAAKEGRASTATTQKELTKMRIDGTAALARLRAIKDASKAKNLSPDINISIRMLREKKKNLDDYIKNLGNLGSDIASASSVLSIGKKVDKLRKDIEEDEKFLEILQLKSLKDKDVDIFGIDSIIGAPQIKGLTFGKK
jgi:hypothetical protein